MESEEMDDYEHELELMFASDNDDSSPPTAEGVHEKKKHFQWTEKCTKLLLELRLQREPIFCRPKCKKKKLWDRLAKDMFTVGGYKVSGKDCEIKYRNMYATFKINKNRTKQSGAGAIKWPWFDLFNKHIGTKQAVCPTEENLGDTIEEQTDKENNDTESETVKKSNRKSRKSLDWKKEYLERKLQEKRAERERKREEWQEKKMLEERKINVLIELNSTLRTLSA